MILKYERNAGRDKSKRRCENALLFVSYHLEDIHVLSPLFQKRKLNQLQKQTMKR